MIRPHQAKIYLRSKCYHDSTIRKDSEYNAVENLTIHQLFNWKALSPEETISLTSEIYESIKSLLSFYPEAPAESKPQVTLILTDLLNLLPPGFSLNLGDNKIGAEGAKAIAQALEKATLPPGFSLELWDNKVGAEGAKAIAQALEKATLPPGFTLKLGKNKIGAEEIAAALEKATLPPEFSLNLRHNKIGAEGAKAIAAALKKATLPPGFSLNLGYNNIGAEGAQAIAQALEKATLPPGFSLNLEHNNIGAEGAKAIAAVLEKAMLPPGFSLNLWRNNIGAEGAQAIAAALKKATLSPGFSLNLRHNNIGDDSIKAITDVLCLNPNICIIDENFYNYNKVNKELLNFIKGDSTLFEEAKRKALTEQMQALLTKHPKNILNLIKWLTEKTTTECLSSFGEYKVLLTIIKALVINPAVKTYHPAIIQLTQNTWLQSTPIKPVALAEDNELTTFAQKFLTKHSEIITQSFNQKKEPPICNMLCATFLALNSDFPEDNPAGPIANKVIERFVNLTITPRQNMTTLPNTAVLEKDLIDLQSAMFSRLYPEEFSPRDDLSSEQRPQTRVITQVGMFTKPAMPNKGLPEIGRVCRPGQA